MMLRAPLLASLPSRLPLVLVLVLALPAAAQLNDPTRPPASLLAPSATSVATGGPATPQLQSILIARHPGGRNVAVIDGMMLRPGDRYKGFVVERMSDTDVVLASGKKRQVLKLYPAASTQEAGAVQAAATPTPR